MPTPIFPPAVPAPASGKFGGVRTYYAARLKGDQVNVFTVTEQSIEGNWARCIWMDSDRHLTTAIISLGAIEQIESDVFVSEVAAREATAALNEIKEEARRDERAEIIVGIEAWARKVGDELIPVGASFQYRSGIGHAIDTILAMLAVRNARNDEQVRRNEMSQVPR